jgi:hypothetical protein
MAEAGDDVKPRSGLGRTTTRSVIRLLAWTPRWLRWDDEADANHELTWGICVVFGVVWLSFTALVFAHTYASFTCSFAFEATGL